MISIFQCSVWNTPTFFHPLHAFGTIKQYVTKEFIQETKMASQCSSHLAFWHSFDFKRSLLVVMIKQSFSKIWFPLSIVTCLTGHEGERGVVAWTANPYPHQTTDTFHRRYGTTARWVWRPEECCLHIMLRILKKQQRRMHQKQYLNEELTHAIYQSKLGRLYRRHNPLK